MHVEWYGQSSFRLDRRVHDGLHRSLRRHDADASTTACAGTTRRSTGAKADLLLVTHEHLDHNGVDAWAATQSTLRSTAGRHESPIGDVLGIASEHDDVAGTDRGASTSSSSTSAGRRVAHLGDLGQRALREEQLAALGTVDLLFVPVTRWADALQGMGHNVDPTGRVPVNMDRRLSRGS